MQHLVTVYNRAADGALNNPYNHILNAASLWTSTQQL